jgi:hypothetical protein
MNELPERDLEYLKEKEYNYELIPHNNGCLLVLRNISFPAAYNIQVVDVLIQIPAGYSNTPLDMFFTPEVKLADGNPPANCEGRLNFDDSTAITPKSWQQWSRHYAWRAGIDSLRTFIPATMKEIAKGK